jgi:hypothetical protein
MLHHFLSASLDGTTSRARYEQPNGRRDKTAIAEQQERIKVQQEEGSTTRTTNRPGQQEQTDGGSRRRSD